MDTTFFSMTQFSLLNVYSYFFIKQVQRNTNKHVSSSTHMLASTKYKGKLGHKIYPSLPPVFILFVKNKKKITETEFLADYFADTILQP